MNLNLGPVKETKTLPCGCIAIVRANGYDTIEPCMGHAIQESGRAMVNAIARLEHAVRMQTDAVASLRPPAGPWRRAGILRRAWRRLFGEGH